MHCPSRAWRIAKAKVQMFKATVYICIILSLSQANLSQTETNVKETCKEISVSGGVFQLRLHAC